MGVRSVLLVYSDGDTADALRQGGDPPLDQTLALVRLAYPGARVERITGTWLASGTFPAEGVVNAAALPHADVICDQDIMFARPSDLPARLAEPGTGRRMVLHGMNSVVDWLGFAVWQDGRLLRSLSVSAEGVDENIGSPLACEVPFWAGEHPVGDADDPYPLPFHPLDLGESVLRELCGFTLDRRHEPEDVPAGTIRLHTFRVVEPEAEARRQTMNALVDELLAQIAEPRR